ncbi:MAG: FMN-binding negative transcriptional regulator [Chloroflexi bacterium]|nr:FMN-binding negative transcriptional regulator [Chloroflexota bacterium]MDL1942447.1 FMN-binding negative transcriptional regulator [Chloroflexi bacterium CFX2]
MYLPKRYREEDHARIVAFLKANSFPALVSHDGEKLVATHLPVEVVENADGSLTILGHMSRANPQWKTFGEQEVLLIFQGAHTYISPRWYNHVNVPTWNYMNVHVYGVPRMVEGEELYDLLSRLVKKHEVNTGYSMEGLPADFVEKEIKGVAGFVLDVTRLDAGYKLSQNRDDESYANIIRELEKRGGDASLEIAKEMRGRR